MSSDYELFEKTILEGGYLCGSNLDSCRSFVEMGKNEGLEISQVCEILVSDNFVTREQIDEIIARIEGGEGPPATDENQEAEAETGTVEAKPQAPPAHEPSAKEAPPSPTVTSPPPPAPAVSVTINEGDIKTVPISAPGEGKAYLGSLLRQCRAMGASDLHISVGLPPIIRLSGEIVRAEHDELTAEQTEAWLREILPEEAMSRFREDRELDFAYTPDVTERYRANAFFDRHGMAASFRIVMERIPTLAELGLPAELSKLTDFRQGLVLITGPAGCGKSTTLAALIGLLNRSRKEHIITIEDPVEFIHHSDQALVNHRQVGANTNSFSAALRAALREAPDIIMVGELRDLETISMAISAAETGHLVFGTLHTRGATRTIDRILDVFPPKEQAQIRAMVSESLRGIVSQQLIPDRDGNGRSLALEILMMTPAASNLIRDGRTFQLRSIIQTGKRYGMRLMDDSLLELVEEGKIYPKEAIIRAESSNLFEKYSN